MYYAVQNIYRSTVYQVLYDQINQTQIFTTGSLS